MEHIVYIFTYCVQPSETKSPVGLTNCVVAYPSRSLVNDPLFDSVKAGSLIYGYSENPPTRTHDPKDLVQVARNATYIMHTAA